MAAAFSRLFETARPHLGLFVLFFRMVSVRRCLRTGGPTTVARAKHPREFDARDAAARAVPAHTLDHFRVWLFGLRGARRTDYGRCALECRHRGQVFVTRRRPGILVWLHARLC